MGNSFTFRSQADLKKKKKLAERRTDVNPWMMTLRILLVGTGKVQEVKKPKDKDKFS